MIITIDGPTASGKSTVARKIAQEEGFFYIASGILFRALGHLLIKEYDYAPTAVDHATEQEIKELLVSPQFKYVYNNSGEHVIFKGAEITHALKNSDIDSAASILGTNMDARHALLDFQRNLALNHSVIIIDGRDCGSVVFPHADFKFFLTASLEVRAKRWQSLQKNLGHNMSLDEAQTFIASRDKRDSERCIAPLIIPEGAIFIDSSDMDQQKVISQILEKLVVK